VPPVLLLLHNANDKKGYSGTAAFWKISKKMSGLPNAAAHSYLRLSVEI
jgi:hypothetical protein